jgi:hypothetical protein
MSGEKEAERAVFVFSVEVNPDRPEQFVVGSRFERKLRDLVNAEGVDAKLGAPDYVLSKMLVDMLESMRVAYMGVRRVEPKDLG